MCHRENKTAAQPEGANDSVDESWDAADPRLLKIIQEKFLERPETPWQPLALKQVRTYIRVLDGTLSQGGLQPQWRALQNI